MDTNLLHCPFCGAPDKIMPAPKLITIKKEKEDDKFTVACLCGTTIGNYFTWMGAAMAWNRRYPSDKRISSE